MSEEGRIYALKRIKLKRSDRATITTYKNEIEILTGLRHQENIIHMVDAEINLDAKVIFVVMESGEIALSKWLQRQQERKARQDKAALQRGTSTGGSSGSGSGASGSVDGDGGDDNVGEAGENGPCVACAVDGNMLRMIWMQMLNAVQTIHEARIVHGDLKAANFVFVEGTLKLIDFGIAKAIGNDTTNIVRDSQVCVCMHMWTVCTCVCRVCVCVCGCGYGETFLPPCVRV